MTELEILRAFYETVKEKRSSYFLQFSWAVGEALDKAEEQLRELQQVGEQWPEQSNKSTATQAIKS